MESSKILQARITLVQMLQQRGFTVPKSLSHLDPERLQIMSDFFWKRHTTRSAVFDIHITNADSQAYVAWLKPNNIKNQYASVIKQFYQELQAGPLDDLVIVVASLEPPTEQMYQWENNQTSVFSVSNLQFNITHHHLVPEHTVLSPAEANRARLAYSAGRGQFPTIQRFQSTEGLGDAVGRFLGMRRGDVVRIRRETKTSGTHVVYREVVGDEPNMLSVHHSDSGAEVVKPDSIETPKKSTTDAQKTPQKKSSASPKQEKKKSSA